MEIFMNLFHIFYVQPMFFAVVETIIMCVVWMVIMLILHRKAQRTISIVCCILSVGVILLFTVHGRSSGEGLQLAPFFIVGNFSEQTELLRTLLMNAFLFIPFGLSMPYALSESIRHKVLITVIAGFMISVSVEACQFFFSLGRCETDDIIMNTLGTFFAAKTFTLYKMIKSTSMNGES